MPDRPVKMTIVAVGWAWLADDGAPQVTGWQMRADPGSTTTWGPGLDEFDPDAPQFGGWSFWELVDLATEHHGTAGPPP